MEGERRGVFEKLISVNRSAEALLGKRAVDGLIQRVCHREHRGEVSRRRCRNRKDELIRRLILRGDHAREIGACDLVVNAAVVALHLKQPL